MAKRFNFFNKKPLADSVASTNSVKRQNSPLIMALEPRIMFDGAAVATAAEAAGIVPDAHAHIDVAKVAEVPAAAPVSPPAVNTPATGVSDLNFIIQSSAAETPAVANSSVVTLQDQDSLQIVSASSLAQNTASGPHHTEVVFIENNVTDLDVLVNGLGSGKEVHILDSTQDGLHQIAEILEGRTDINSVHIISHGVEGALNLGTLSLNSADIGEHTEDLQTIGKSLTADGDILLYGCNVSHGSGNGLIEKIATITGADVAASNNATGSEIFGGDWNLEIQQGDINTPALVDAHLSSLYTHILDITSATVTFTDSTGHFVSNGSKSSASGNVTYDVNGNSSYRLVVDGATQGTYHYIGYNYILADAGTAGETAVVFSFAAGNKFTANSIKIANYAGSPAAQTLEFRAYDASNAQIGSTSTLSLPASDRTLKTVTFTGFTDISTLKMTSTTGGNKIHYVAVDDFSLSNIRGLTTLSNATYDASTGSLVVTGAGMTTGDTIDVSKLSLTGQGGSYTLTSSNVTASSATSFTVALNAADKININGILNNNGTASVGATTYNLAGAANWDSTKASAADLTSNGVTVSNVAAPTVTSATYDASTHTLVVTGTGLVKTVGATNDITVSKLTFTGEAGATYSLSTSSNVEITSATSFSVTLSGADIAGVETLLNKNGTSSVSTTTYNLAAADDWDSVVGNSNTADLTANGITVSNAAPVVASATYDASTGSLVVTAANMVTGDTIDVSKLSLAGQAGSYTLTSANVTAASATSFTVTLNAADLININGILNKNGTSAVDTTTFNLAAAASWDASRTSGADLTSNGVTVSNVAAPTITSATYNATTHVLVVTGNGLVKTIGATNDITVNKLTLTGEGGSTYTLTASSNVEITSATSFSITLTGADITGVGALLNKNGTSSLSTTTYNLAAADDWDSVITGGNIADLTGNGITVSAVPNATPVITNLNGDSVAWAGVGSTVTLDVSGNAALSDAELNALNSGNGNWSGGSLTAQRSGTAITADTFGFNLSGALFTVSGSNLQSGGLTFATFTNTGGLLTINFTSSGTTATTALINDVAQRITYRNDTPAGDATVRFTLSDGTASTTADVTVTSDTIYVTNSTDTATIDITNGVSFSEAIGIAAADATGSQTIVFASSLASTALTISSVTLNESLTFDMDAASGMSLTSGTITLSSGTLSLSNGTGDTATISSVLTSSGALTKIGAGTVTMAGINTYTGATTISAGTLTVSSGDAIATASSVAVASGATLSLSANETVGNISGAGSIALGSNTLSTWVTADTTFSGNIGGSGALNINQTGAATFALTLSGTNTFTGATTLQNFGWLKLNGEASYSDSSQLRVNGNSKLTLLSDQTVGSIAGNASTASINLGTYTLTAGGDTNSTSVANVISGTGNLVKQGAGTLTLSGTNTYSGTTTVSAGILSISSDANLGSDTITLASGSTLSVTGTTNIDNAITLTGAATIDSSAATTLSGAISGANSLTKVGSSTLTLSGTNSYGATSVNAGTLSIASDNNLGSDTVTLAAGSALAITGATTIDNAIALAGAATIGNSAAVTLSGVVSGSSTLTKTGASTLTLTGTNTHTGDVTVLAGGLTITGGSSIGNTSAVILTFGSNLTLAGGTETIGSLAGSGNVVLNYRLTTGGNNTSTTFSGEISGSGNGIAKAGTGNFTLDGVNTFTGSTQVTGGTLTLSGGAALANSNAVTVGSGATLALIDSNEAIGSLAGAGTVTLAGFALTAGGDNSNTTFSGNLSGSGTLTKAGSGTLILSGTNSGSVAGIQVNAGTLSVASDNNLGAGSVNLANGTTLSITGITTIDNALALTGVVAINTDAAATISGVISGGGLIKTGSSKLTLSGTNTYTGTTTVSVGVLAVNGSTAGATTVSSGATLAGSGSLGGSVLVLSGGILSPGNSTGILTINGNLTMAAGSTLAIEINGTTAGSDYDQVIVNGAVNGSAATLAVTHGYTPSQADAYTIIDNDASDLISLTFNGLAESGTVTAAGNGTILTASYIGGTGNDFTLTAPINPVVTNISASTVNGGYKIGDTITVTVTLDQAVNVDTTGGTPTLLLETGAIDRNAVYISGSGTNMLNFSYTVQAGDTSSDLDYQSSAALTLNGGTIRDAGSNDASLTLPTLGGVNSLAGQKAIVIDGIAPTVASVSVPTNGTYVASQNLDFTVNLSENIVVDTSGGTPRIAVTLDTGGTVYASYLSGSGTSALVFRAIVTSGQLDTNGISLGSSIDLNGGTLKDTVGNNALATLNSVGSTTGVLVDAILPTASIVVADTALAAGETSLVTITFSEAVTGFTNADLTISNGTLSTVGTSDGGITWTATLTPTASLTDATNVITLNNATVQDLAGNAGTGTTDSNNYAIDTARPTASIVVADNALAAGETSLVTITFSEAVTGFTNTDLTIANGTLNAVGTSDGGITWTATLTPTASITDATNVITLANTGVQDTAGNAGVGTTDSNNYAIDTARPTANIVVADSALAVGETSLVTITFSEAVTGFTNADLTIANGTLSAVGSSDGGITWTATFTPAGSITDSTNMITLANTGVQDSAGNTGTGTTDSNNYAIDSVRPTASVVVTDSALAVGETSLVTITFSEAVTGFTNADLTIANGTLSAVNSSDGGVTWTATFTPTASMTDSTNVITLANTGVQDVAGNTGTGTTDSNNYAIDTVRPTATIVVADTALAVGETSLVTLTFSEAVANFDNNDLTVANGTVGNMTTSDGGITWTGTLTPTTNITDATNVIAFDSTGVIDGAGNVGAGVISSNNYAIDTARLTATIVVADNALAVGETSLVTFTFSEAVNGFSNTDLTVANGALTAVSSSDGGITWTATFTPTANITDTTNVITLDNTGVQDAAGNTGTGTTDSNNYVIDALAPTVGSVSVPVGVPYNAGDVLSFTVNTSEVVTVNTAGGTPRLALDVGGSTQYATYVAGSGTNTLVFQYTVQAGDNDANGISLGALQANGGTLRDPAGNDLNLVLNNISDTSSVIVDTTAPTTSSIVITDTSLIKGETSTVTITFNEAVTGLDIGDFTVANGTLSDLNSSDGGITWTAKLTPTANITDTTNIINLNNAELTDIAGNAGTGSIDSNNYAIDTLVPTVSSVSVPPGVPYNAGDVLTFTVNTSEKVLVNTAGGTPRLALDIGGTSVFANYIAGSNTTTLVFQYTIKAGDNSNINVGNLTANGATLRDAAGNDLNTVLSNVGSTDGISVDTTAPVVSSSSVQGAPASSSQTVNFVVTFSEAVDHVDLSDLSLSTTDNAVGSLSGLTQINDHSWQATVSGISGNGTIRVDVKGTTDITDSADNALASGFTTGASFTAQQLPPPPVSIPLAPLTPTVNETPTQTQVPIPLIVLSPDTTSIGGNTNSTPLTTVEAPALATIVNSSLSVAGASNSPTSLDTSTPGTDPIGIATATNSGTPNPQTGMLHLASGNQNVSGPASGPTIDRINTTQDGSLQNLPVVGTVNAQTGIPLYIPLPNTQSADVNQQLSVDVRMQNGRPLVNWLHFDPVTGSLSGQAPKGFEGKLQIQINVRDSKGNTSSSIIELNFNGERDNKPAPVKTKPGAQLMGKPGLNEQFALHGKGAHQIEADALLNVLNQLSIAPAPVHAQAIVHKA